MHILSYSRPPVLGALIFVAFDIRVLRDIFKFTLSNAHKKTADKSSSSGS